MTVNNNIRNIGISLQDIVKNSERGLYLIPNFQRDFVWKENDIIDLGDSIIRGYPISSLLLIPENGALKIVSKNLIKNEFIRIDEGDKAIETDRDSSTKFYVLDGQQRLTSIAKLFLLSDNKRVYYYDLLAILVDKFPHDRVEKNLAFSDSHRLRPFPSLCHSFPIKKDKSEQSARENYRYISGKTIVANQFGSIVNKFLRTLKGISEENFDKYTDYLNAILAAVNSYNISATEISRDAELGVIIRVFEKVNSTGKKLTLFDLINAKSYQIKTDYLSDGLSIFFKKRIDSVIDEQPWLKEPCQHYFKYNEKEESYQELARIVRIFEIAYLLNHNQAPAMSGPTMLNRRPEHWFEMWEKNEKNLFDTLDWFYQQQIIGTAPSTFIEYMIAIFLAAPNALHQSIFKSEIQKCAFYYSIHNLNFNKSNLDTVERFYEAAKEDSYAKQQRLNIVNLTSSKLESENILACTTTRAKFRAVLTILYQRPDNKPFVDNKTNSSHNCLHYIYPKKFVNQYPFNSIANIIYLHPSMDEKKVKDLSLYFYLTKLKEKLTSNQFTQYCQHNLIDPNQVPRLTDEQLVHEFIKKRAEKIATIINEYFGYYYLINKQE